MRVNCDNVASSPAETGAELCWTDEPGVFSLSLTNIIRQLIAPNQHLCADSRSNMLAGSGTVITIALNSLTE